MGFKFWLNIITFVALAILLYFSRADIMEVFHQLANLNLWVLALILPAQALAFYLIAKIFHSYIKASSTPNVSMKELFKFTMEVNFVHHVFPSAGVAGLSYTGMRMKKFGITTAQSTMLQIVRTVFAFMMFIPLLFVGVLMLSIEDRASNLIILVASSLTTAIIICSLLLAYILGSRQRIHSAALQVVKIVNRCLRIVRRDRHPETIKVVKVEDTLSELHEHYLEVRANIKHLRPVFLWALASNICELLLVYIVFIAHGEFINPGALIIGFAMANAAGLIAFLPGGIGVYEPLMATALVAGGVNANVALSAILVYRVIVLLISLPTGYFLYHKALKEYDGKVSLKR